MGYRVACLLAVFALILLVGDGASFAQSAVDDSFPRGAVFRVGSGRFRSGTFIEGLAYSPDGKHLAVSSGNRTSLLEVNGGNVLFSVDGQAPAFTADGRSMALVVSSKEDRSARPVKAWPVIIDVATGKEIKRIDTGDATINSVAFSPDGKMLAAALAGGRMRTYDVASGRLVAQFVRPGNWSVGEHIGIKWSTDGKTIVSLFHSIPIEWDVASHSVRQQGPENPDQCGAIDFAPDGKTVLKLPCLGAFARDGRLSASIEQSSSSIGFPEAGWPTASKLILTDLQTGSKRELATKMAWLNAIAFSPDGKTLATGGADCAVRFWNVGSGKPITDPAVPDGALYAAALSPDLKMIAVGGVDRTIRILEYPSGKPIRVLAEHDTTVVAVAFSPDGRSLVSFDRNSVFRIWDVERGVSVKKGKGEGFTGPPFGSAFWVDGQQPLVMGREGVFSIDSQSGEIRKHRFGEVPVAGSALSFFSHPAWCWWSSDAEPLPRVSHTNSAAASNEPIGERLPWSTCIFSPDRKELVVALGDTVRFFDAQTGKLTRKFLPKADHEEGRPIRYVRQLGFAPGGKLLVVVQDARPASQRSGHIGPPEPIEQVIRVFSTLDWKELQTFHGHSGRCNSLTFHGQYAITASEDGTALVWDLNTPPAANPTLAKSPSDLWNVAIGDDRESATDAVLELAKQPREAVTRVTSYFGSPAEDKEIASLVQDLASNEFPTRFNAMRVLAESRRSRQGVEIGLVRFALNPQTTDEARHRATMLIEGIDPVMNGGGTVMSSDRDRLFRLILLLERCGNPEAKALLIRIAQVLPERRGGAAARDALGRLGVPAVIPLYAQETRRVVPTTVPTQPVGVTAPALRTDSAQLRPFIAMASDRIRQDIEQTLAQIQVLQSTGVRIVAGVDDLLAREDLSGAYDAAMKITNIGARNAALQRVAASAHRARNKEIAVKAYSIILDLGDRTFSISGEMRHPAVGLVQLGRSDIVTGGLDRMSKAQFDVGAAPLTWEAIADAMLEIGDFSSARTLLAKCATLLPSPLATNNFANVTTIRLGTCLKVARLQCRAKDLDGAAQTLARGAAHLAALEVTPEYADAVLQAQVDLADAYLAAGCRAQYEAQIKNVLKEAAGLKRPQARYNVLAAVATHQARSGQLTAALTTMQSLNDDTLLANSSLCRAGDRPGSTPASGPVVWTVIADAQWRSGDRTGAEKSLQRALTVGSIKIEGRSLDAIELVAGVHVANRDPQGALKVLSTAGRKVSADCACPIAEALVHSADLTGAMQVIGLTDDPGLPTRYYAAQQLGYRLFSEGDHAGGLAIYCSSPVRNFGGSRLPEMLNTMAEKGDMDLVLRSLDTGQESVIGELVRVRLKVRDTLGAQRIVERGLEAALAAPPHISESTRNLLDLMSQIAPKEALRIAEISAPKSEPSSSASGTMIQPSGMALFMMRAGDEQRAISTIGAISDPSDRDRAIVSLIRAMVGPEVYARAELTRRQSMPIDSQGKPSDRTRGTSLPASRPSTMP